MLVIHWNACHSLERLTFTGTPDIHWNARHSLERLTFTGTPVIHWNACHSLEHLTFTGTPDIHWNACHSLERLSFIGTPDIHWNACCYFLMSLYNGFGSDDWVYPDINETLYPRNATLLKMYTYRSVFAS